MKSKTNIFLLISFLIALSLTAWAYYQSTHKVGELIADKNIDKDFEICNDKRIYEYYNYGTEYIGGKKEIKNRIFSDLEFLNFKETGLVTFRFVVNCNGEIGRFRVKSIDKDLKKNEISSENIREIEKALLKLKNWNPGKNKYGAQDSYYLLNFKIENNKIIDIF